MAKFGLESSPISEILIETSIKGWKEYELEVMRDRADNCVVICSIENLDPMGVHTGDSITVAPAQTLSDVEYQLMRDAAFACIRRVGVETGGSNVQFAIDPANGDMVVIEMNPRVSRSSALASKATGFPIAKMAAKLAVGYTLDEIPNDITKATPASFEPVIDYVVTKVPRWAFEKFPGQADVLGTSMQSVGEAMAIGRTFPESMQKALRSLEQGRHGLNCDPGEAPYDDLDLDELLRRATIATPDRPFQLEAVLRRGVSIEQVAEETKVDPWFLDQLMRIVDERAHLAEVGFAAVTRAELRRAKRLGFSDAQLAYLWSVPETDVRARRLAEGLVPTYKTVDTCAAEFEAKTPYHYSTWEDDDEVVDTGDRPVVIILGSGPNRIGQGIEFDYCCVHASFALRDAGYETVMVNCNPETVSTDYDTSDRLYFEPLTFEDTMSIVDAERAAGNLEGHHRQPRRPDAAEAGRPAPRGTGARHQPPQHRPRRGPRPVEPAVRPARDPATGRRHRHRPRRGPGHRRSHRLPRPAPPQLRAGRPGHGDRLRRRGPRPGDEGARRLRLARHGRAACRPSVRCSSTASSRRPPRSTSTPSATTPARCIIGGVMEHVEEAGVHSGDSACSIPPHSLSDATVEVIEDHTRKIAEALDVEGLHQRAVRRPRRAGVRDRGQPPGQPHGAVRGQGHRRSRW